MQRYDGFIAFSRSRAAAQHTKINEKKSALIALLHAYLFVLLTYEKTSVRCIHPA